MSRRKGRYMEILDIIDKQIRELWTNDISSDYHNWRLLKEDCLKNAFYFHLRRRLGDVFLDEHDLQIFTEFDCGPLKGTGKRADLAIIKINNDSEAEFLGDCVEDVVAIVEFKYKGCNQATAAAVHDVKKMQSYIQDNRIDCKYYLAVVSEAESAPGRYVDGKWADGTVTELLASYDQNGDMCFKVAAH